jgi:hypothetical protein
MTENNESSDRLHRSDRLENLQDNILADLALSQWTKIVANNPSFAFLHDPEEDIYTLEDGITVSYEGGEK